MTDSKFAIDELFQQALEIPAGPQREAFLEQIANHQPQIGERLARLLQAAAAAGDFLEKPAQTPFPASDSPQPLDSMSSTFDFSTQMPQIGPYRLIQKIGQGGMGVVYLAEQTRPVRRQVALKLIRPGLDSDSIIDRFETERQALAMMDHPNIARVLDAGTIRSSEFGGPIKKSDESADTVINPTQVPHSSEPDGPGRPYFVMELVSGLPITEYCDQHRLSLRERLELFVPVCQAVQHAHQKGIIHRDLKPSNILVAVYENMAIPKIIDFGVAKAVCASLTDKSQHTGFGAVVGTIEYMSPGQAGLNSVDVDTRSDVYSLGAVLYELLAGTPPFSRQELSVAGMLEMLAIVREQDPHLPSHRLSRSEFLGKLAGSRNTDARRLSGIARGKLDWIVIKSLEKDRNRRYESASQLAIDIRRYLQGQPIAAAPPSWVYRCQKWIRRNQLSTALVAAIGMGLLLAFAGISWGYYQSRASEIRAMNLYRDAEIARQAAAARAAGERRALLAVQAESQAKDRAIAEEARQRKFAEAIREFVQYDVLALTTQEGQMRFGGQDLPRGATLRDLLMRSANRLRERTDLSPSVSAELNWIVGISLRAIGEYDVAIPFLEKAVTLYSEIQGDQTDQALNAMNSLAIALMRAGRVESALEWQKRVLAGWARLQGPDRIHLYRAQRAAATTLLASHRPKEALKLLDQAEQGFKSLPDSVVDDLANVQVEQARAMSFLGDYSGATELLQNLTQQYELEQLSDVALNESVALEMGNNLIELGQLDAAEQFIAGALPQIRHRLGDLHPSTLEARSIWGTLLSAKGDTTNAVQEFEAIHSVRKNQLGDHHPDTIIATNNLALAHQKMGQTHEAYRLFSSASTLAVRHLGAGHRYTMQIRHNLALVLQDLGQHVDSEQILKEVLNLRQQNLGPKHPETLMTANSLAASRRALGQLESAYQLLSSATPELEVALGLSHPNSVTAKITLAVCLKDLGRQAEAISLLDQVLGIELDQLPESAPLRWKALNNLAVIYWRQKKPERSIPLLEQVVELSMRYRGDLNDRALLMAQANLGINLRDIGRTDEAVELLFAAYDGGRNVSEFDWVRSATIASCIQTNRDDLLFTIFWDDVWQLASSSGGDREEKNWSEWPALLNNQGDFSALQIFCK